MKFFLRATGIAMVMGLAGCGGGSGNVASTPAPPPAPASNASLADLTVTQSFTNDAATLSGNWDIGTGTAIDGTARKASLTIRYNADTGSYALSTDNRSQTFSKTSITRQESDLVEYRQTTASGSENMTLFTETGTSASRKYVGMGFWQSNVVSNGRQATEFSTYSYGLPTASAAVPRTGSAAFAIDVFGLVTAPGEEPASFDGTGKLSLDFAQGLFSAQAYTTELGLVKNGSVSGGGIELRAAGALSATTGVFSGNAVYGSYLGQSSGTIDGRLYGPGAQEVGATFHTTGAGGLAAVGSLIGSRDPSQSVDNMTLTALRAEQRFYTISQGSVGSLTILNPETFDFSGYSSDMVGGRFTTNEKVTSTDPNFTAYEKTGNNGYGDQKVRLELYKPGSANSELALTYASFGHWTGSGAGIVQENYFTYGFVTGDNLLSARTGKARYEGVAYGSGTNSDASARYNVKGTSSFDVDFSALSFGGALSLVGTERTTGARADFGAFTLGGNLFLHQSTLLGDVSRAGTQVGNVWAQFFGPNGQELAGTFYLNAPAGTGEAREVGIQGAFVTVVK